MANKVLNWGLLSTARINRAMEAAIRRERQIKEWRRAWKVRRIEEMNPEWRDLHDQIDVLATLVGE